MATTHRVDPRVRAYGKARIDITRRAQNETEWQSQWREPRYPFPFKFGNGWKLCTQYLVEDFAAEIGFFMDVLGFPVGAFSPNYAQFTSPSGDFTFGVASADGIQGTPPESICLQFMVDDLPRTIEELERRGIQFEHKPEAMDTSPEIAMLRTPHGVRLELWGIVQSKPPEKTIEQLPLETHVETHAADFWADYPEETPESEQPKSQADEGVEDSDEEADLEDGILDEPVYVDEEDIQAEVITASPHPVPPQSRPAFPTAVIRQVEDLEKGGIPPTGRKIKGNGMRGFPTLNLRHDGQDG